MDAKEIVLNYYAKDGVVIDGKNNYSDPVNVINGNYKKIATRSLDTMSAVTYSAKSFDLGGLKDGIGIANDSFKLFSGIFGLIEGIFKDLQKTAKEWNGSLNDAIKRVDDAVASMNTALEKNEKIKDGDIINLFNGFLAIAGNAVAITNPALGITIGLASTSLAGIASLMQNTTIAQNIVDGSLTIFNNVINSLESQGVDFSNSMIVPEELPHTLQDLWKEVTGAYKDKMVGDNEDNVLFGGRGNDVLYGYSGDDVLIGGTGQDVIFGGKGNDYISGGQGWDRIDGGLGDDFINGGNGNDILKGGMGDDTYFFKKGDGMDTISDMPAANLANKDGGYDTILFDKDVKKEDITFLNIAGVLSIKYDEKNKGLISAFGHFLDDRRSIEKIELSSTGEFITKDQISKVIQDLNSYAKDNMIVLTHDNVKNNAELMNIVMSGWQTA